MHLTTRGMPAIAVGCIPSAAFAADATWRQQPGLAASGLISFGSYSVPGQYIRQRDSLLYLTPILTETDQVDATFLEEY